MMRPHLPPRLNFAQLAALGYMASALSLFDINWPDLSTPPLPIAFIAGTSFLALSSISTTVHSAILQQKLPPQLQVKCTSMLFAASQVMLVRAPPIA